MVKATTSRAQAVEVAWRIWREHDRKTLAAASTAVTVAELRRRWLATEGDETDPRHTLEINTRPVMTLAHQPADTIRPAELLAIQQKLVAGGLSVRTINRRIRAIVRMFRWGVPRDLVTPEQWWGMAAIEAVKVCAGADNQPREIAPADPAAVYATLARCRPMLWRMIVVQMLTGMRSGELVQMCPCHIDRSEGCAGVWRYRVPFHKTKHRGHVRVVAIGPRAQEVLEPMLLYAQPEAFLFTPEAAEAERGSRRRPGHGRALRASYTPHSYQQAIEYAQKKAGVTHWHAHQLRHLAGTVAREAADLDGAQAMLGHRHARVTEVYARLAVEKAARVAAVVG